MTRCDPLRFGPQFSLRPGVFEKVWFVLKGKWYVSTSQGAYPARLVMARHGLVAAWYDGPSAPIGCSLAIQVWGNRNPSWVSKAWGHGDGGIKCENGCNTKTSQVWNICYFHPYLGKWSNLTNIFQMGWNHQPEKQEDSKKSWIFDWP